MALYRYQAKTPEGETKAGTIEAASLELAVSSLQRRGLVIIALEPAEGRMSWWQQAAASFERVKSRDIVVLSRQFATLFEAKVPVVQALRVLIDETSNQTLKKHLSEVPIYTRIVIGFSNFLREFGVFLIVLLAVGGIFLWRWTKTASGRLAVSRFLIELPFFGILYRKIYLSRLTDNLQTLLAGGVTVLRSLEISADVVGNEIYAQIVRQSMEQVKGGLPISEAFSRYEDIPALVTQMIRIGEETGKLDFTLKTLARFYRNEVYNTVENLVSLIEPVMITFLGLAVGFLVASVLIPIYNISTSI